MVGSINGFVNNASTHQGAEFDSAGIDELDQLLGDDDDDGSDLESGDEEGVGAAKRGGGSGGGDADAPVSFDPATFLSTLQGLADQFGCDLGLDLSAPAPGISAPSPTAKPATAHTPSRTAAAPSTAQPARGPPQKAKDDKRDKEDKEDKEGVEDLTMDELAEMMDAELSTSVLPESLTSRGADGGEGEDGEDEDDEGEGGGDGSGPIGSGSGSGEGNGERRAKPVDLDFNLVKNALESYGAQQGMSGPLTNMLGSMGLALPDNQDAAPDGRPPQHKT